MAAMVTQRLERQASELDFLEDRRRGSPMGEVVGETGHSGQAILIVDDDLDAAQMFALLLQELGHTVEYVTRAHAVLDIAKRMRPWLIFLDIRLPEMNGWELARLLRRELGYDTVRIVAVTGYGEPEAHRRSREAGFDAHVQKPVDMELLQSILAEIGH
jgi:CheY-like chemotaxis protein